MFIVEHYALAIVFTFITMFCWGSWANSQKLVQKRWRFELFYWDYVIGIFLLSLLVAFTLGSHGDGGRPFLVDLKQADSGNLLRAFAGGAVFNLANILLTAAIAGAGMAVAFPIGIGLALIIGVLINYILLAKGDPYLLFGGVILIMLAILLNAAAFKKHAGSMESRSVRKWIAVSIIAGVLMSTFYPLVASGIELENFVSPAAGKMTPYTAFVVFALGILSSNLIFNTILMRRPLEGASVSYRQYFGGGVLHLGGILGGIVWGCGNIFNLIAAGKAGPAISYGLGQGATLVAAFWGVFIWKEFKGASSQVNRMIAAMFVLFIAGIVMIIVAGR